MVLDCVAESRCPLCKGAGVLWHREHRHKLTPREYHRCSQCQLVYVPAAWHLSPAEEKAHYDYHQNDPADPGYRRFLSRAVTPLLAWLSGREGAKGLDFGCGPTSAVAVMLAEHGIHCAQFDPYYRPDRRLLEQQFDFIVSTEVFEHLRQPGQEIAFLVSRLHTGGVLVVMTKRVRDLTAFRQWHYSLDPTHISYFSEQTFAWIAEQYGLRLEIIGPDVVMLHRDG